MFQVMAFLSNVNDADKLYSKTKKDPINDNQINYFQNIKSDEEKEFKYANKIKEILKYIQISRF